MINASKGSVTSPFWPMQWASTTDLFVSHNIMQWHYTIHSSLQKHIHQENASQLWISEQGSSSRAGNGASTWVRQRRVRRSTVPFWVSAIKRNSCTVSKQPHQVAYVWFNSYRIADLGLVSVPSLHACGPAWMTMDKATPFWVFFTYYFILCLLLMFLYCIY